MLCIHIDTIGVIVLTLEPLLEGELSDSLSINQPIDSVAFELHKQVSKINMYTSPGSAELNRIKCRLNFSVF